jgi:hypothetical protein
MVKNIRRASHHQSGSAAMLLVLWAFVAVFYFLFAPQITASAKAFAALAATEESRLDDVARRLTAWYRQNAADIDANPIYVTSPSTLWAVLGVEAMPTLQLGISDSLDGSQVRFRRFAVWLRRANPDPSTFVASSGAFTPGPGVIYRIVDGEAIVGQMLEETLSRMKVFAAQLERRFRAKFEADPGRTLTVNHFRALGPSCATSLDDIPCIDVHTDVSSAADFGLLLSVDPTTLVSAWGQRFTVSNLADSQTASPPYSMAIRAALPWGDSLLVNAIQQLN